MKRILLATGSKKSSDAFRELISEGLEGVSVITADSGGSARLRLKEPGADLVIVNTPMADERGIDLAVHAAERENCAVILVTDSVTRAEITDDMQERGILVAERPLEKKIFVCMLQSMAIFANQLRILKEENRKLQECVEEARLISRAKGMLMSQLNMTEAQAHRYIEKQAMDLRIQKKTVSQNILKTYYNK